MKALPEHNKNNDVINVTPGDVKNDINKLHNKDYNLDCFITMRFVNVCLFCGEVIEENEGDEENVWAHKKCAVIEEKQEVINKKFNYK